jgi:hypothetical protein
LSRFLGRLRGAKDSLKNEAWRARAAWKMEAWRARAEERRVGDTNQYQRILGLAEGKGKLLAEKDPDGFVAFVLAQRAEVPPREFLMDVLKIGEAECRRRGWPTGQCRSIADGRKGRLVVIVEQSLYFTPKPKSYIEVDPKTMSVTRAWQRSP